MNRSTCPRARPWKIHPENDELAELEAEIEASRAEFERGEFVDAHAFALKLVAKS